MNKESLSKVFDPSFSTKNSGRSQGHGLGLSLAHYIITEKHYGLIRIDSQKNKGTMVHIYLPKADEPVKLTTEKEPIQEKDETILVIEDEDMVRETALKALNSFGYKAFGASDGNQGLNFFKENHKIIDAVILDIIMPNMSGTEAFKQMLEIDPKVNVIIASGHVTNQDQKKLFTKAKAYLEKPYEIMELKKTLRSLFR